MAILRPFRLFLVCLFVIFLVEERYASDATKHNTIVGAKVCMDVLGCFEITSDFFDLIKRPVNLLPQNRSIINTQFFLYTNNNVKEKEDLRAENSESITSSHFNPNHPTEIIIHGYIDNQDRGPWKDKMRDAFLLKGDHNVIIVDWSGGNGLPYTQAVANSRVVGAEVALLIKALQEHTGMEPKNCHILGHSLGAHAAGYAGERIKGLGRITGLDPAEPYFQGLPPTVRLDETDAEFVDILHTDSRSILLLGQGMSQPIGHVDFYPNDGKNQPGCSKDKVNIITGTEDGGLLRFVGCNHQRAVDFYTSSIVLTKCIPVSYQCSSWGNFLKGRCSDCGSDGSKCSILGDRAIESKGLKQKHKKFYVQTSGEEPYCLFHYKVVVKLYRSKSSRDTRGKFELTFVTENGEASAKIDSKAIKLSHGSSYPHLLTTETEIENLKSITFKWSSSGKVLDPLNLFRNPKLYVEYIKIIPMNIVDQKEKLRLTEMYCSPDKTKPINSGASKTFIRKSNC